MANKRKTTTAIVAGVTAAALLLGGTFAWTSISQTAKNEAIVDINPGGRLHDDFDGRNKDVYVENFSSGATGVDIFARIRLDQYFEVGQEAGKNKTAAMADRNVDALIGTDIDDVTTWETYKPGDTLSAPIQANDNWQWTLGNDDSNLPYYMPTFNMNKDSLLADINGTYEGTVNGDIVHYDDYTKYDANSTEEGTEVYDRDEDTTEEDGDTVAWDNGGITYDDTTPIDSADVYHKSTVTDDAGKTVNLTHTAKQISTTATVITMAEWLALPEEEQTGNFWVYDTDGWAYWAQPIAPGETTGLLLDGINMSKVPDDNWYYGINVVGQFATASDWTMLYSKTGEEADAMSEGAKQLMELITDVASSEDEGNNDDITENGTLTLTSDNADTETVTVGTELPVEFDTIGLDTTVEGYVAPDISVIVATIGAYDEQGEWIGETELTEDQYTYEYDQTTGKGTLTITDPTLEKEYIYVYDKNEVVEGQVYVETEEDYILTLDIDNNDTVYATVDTEITVEFDTTGLDTDTTQPDISEIIVTVETIDEEGNGTETKTLTAGTEYTYTYDEETQTGTLIITDTTLTGTVHVTDKNKVVEGDVYVETEDDGGDDGGETGGTGVYPLILVDGNDVLEASYGKGATFTLSLADTIEGVAVTDGSLSIIRAPESGVEITENDDGTITVKVTEVSAFPEDTSFVIQGNATLGDTSIGDYLGIWLYPDLTVNGISIYLPAGYASGMSPGFGGTFTASSEDVTWSISGNNDTDTSIEAVYDEETNEYIGGFLGIGNNETAETIIIKVASTTDSNLYGTYELKILTDGMLSITATTADGTTKLVAKDIREDTQTETDFTDTYTWTVSPESGLTVAEDGTLTATTAGTYTVTATSNSNSRVTATIEVTVNDDLSITVPTTETTEPTE